MDGSLIAECFATAFFATVAARAVWADSQKRKRAFVSEIVPALAAMPAPYKYEIRPFRTCGDLYTFEEFKDLLKIYSCGNDNGTSHWASAEGLWFNRASNDVVRACPHEIRLGRRPEMFFTHIMYYPK